MSYAIIRNTKYKRENLKGIFRHNERKNKNYSNDNIDKEKSYLNYSIKQPKYSYEKEFDKTGIVVYYDGIDVTEEAEVKYDNVPSYDNKNFDYIAKYTVTYNGESYVREIAVQIGLKGDTNLDHEIDVFDAVYIARYTVSNPKFPIEENTLRYFLSDMSSPKNQIDVFDAIWIARKSNEFAPEPKPVRPTLHMPKEKDYNTNTIAGLKKYVNDCIVYKAAIYEIPKERVYFKDDINEWNYSWDVPAIYISDMDYYYNQQGYYPFCYDSKASKAAKSAMFRVESFCNELISIDEKPKNAELTIKWKHLGHNNYEIYVMCS